MDTAEIDSMRSLFPITRKYIYLDHAGVAPISEPVRREMEKAVRQAAEEGAFAYTGWSERIEKARESCGRLINAEKSEIAFVRSTSHGISIVAGGITWKAGDNVLFCDGDFPSNMFPWEHLAERGVEIRRVPKRNGRLIIEDFESRMDGRTRIVSVSTVQFIEGFHMDLMALGKLSRRKGTYLCVDAIQSVGLLETDVEKYGVDFLSADAHKWLMGPEGIGMFYCRKGLAAKLDPVLIGWNSSKHAFQFEDPKLELRTDARRFEEGSSNVIGIIGLGASADMLLDIGIGRIQGRVRDLGEMIINQAASRGYDVLTPRERKERGGAITFRGGFDPVELQRKLRERSIMVNVRGGGIRVSPHFYNTEEEIERLFEAMDELRDDVRQGA